MMTRTLRHLLGLALLLTICALFAQTQSASAASASVHIDGGCSPAQRLLNLCGVPPTSITPTVTATPSPNSTSAVTATGMIGILRDPDHYVVKTAEAPSTVTATSMIGIFRDPDHYVVKTAEAPNPVAAPATTYAASALRASALVASDVTAAPPVDVLAGS